MEPNESMTDPCWTVADVARVCHLSKKTIYLWAEEGKFPGSKLGRVWRFVPSEVRKFIKNRSNFCYNGPVVRGVERNGEHP
jgi:excisionase family DNA binding protein